MASDGAPQAGPMLHSSSSSSSSSSSARDGEMAIRLQSATSLTIRALQEITDDFSEQRKIGQGAYGKVYVAKLENGEDIAVKMLYNNMPGIDDEQFQREFENLMRLKHQNIVRLVGYCYETQYEPMQYKGRTIFAERTYRALCFEYMQNGSLEKHISDVCDGLDWLTRYQIIKGTCKGLKHLHEGFGEPIYHLDLKPDNILLDKNMVPKLADFGLSKLFGEKQTMTTHSPIGTIGYIPMEFLHGHIISNKFDIFSLGVVMIKTIAGHGGYSKSAEMPRQEFLNLVHENWRNKMLKTCRDSRSLEAFCEQVNTCTEIALSCMEIDRHKRPTIADIVHRLKDTETVIDKALSWRASAQLLMNENSVRLEALTKSEVIPYAEREDEYPILVRFTAPPWRHVEEIPRAGVDLVVVLFMSYMRYLDTANINKQAMIMIIDMLGPNDRLSIMSEYGCIMKLTSMSENGRDVARRMVENLVVKDVDTKVDPVGEGAKLLEGREVEEEGGTRLGFIMVLFRLWYTDSDTLMPEISSKFPVHTLSFEPYGYSAEAMKFIADKTCGTYSFVQQDMYELEEDAMDMCALKDALELFIGGITKVAATSIKITLAAHEGVTISSIESGGYSSNVNSKERSGEIDINDIYAGETKNFIVKLKLAEGKGKLLTIGGHYCSLGESKQLADTDVFVLRPRSGCSPGKLAMHPEVAAELVRLRLLKSLSYILWRDDRPFSFDLEVLWENIRSSEEGRCASEETLDGLAKETEKMQRCTYKKQPYALSWLSCHKWQRATTKGSCRDSGAIKHKYYR